MTTLRCWQHCNSRGDDLPSVLAINPGLKEIVDGYGLVQGVRFSMPGRYSWHRWSNNQQQCRGLSA